jgi:hypothetical protein
MNHQVNLNHSRKKTEKASPALQASPVLPLHIKRGTPHYQNCTAPFHLLTHTSKSSPMRHLRLSPLTTLNDLLSHACGAPQTFEPAPCAQKGGNINKFSHPHHLHTKFLCTSLRRRPHHMRRRTMVHTLSLSLELSLAPSLPLRVASLMSPLQGWMDCAHGAQQPWRGPRRCCGGGMPQRGGGARQSTEGTSGGWWWGGHSLHAAPPAVGATACQAHSTR